MRDLLIDSVFVCVKNNHLIYSKFLSIVMCHLSVRTTFSAESWEITLTFVGQELRRHMEKQCKMDEKLGCDDHFR